MVEQKRDAASTDIWVAYHDKLYQFCLVYMKDDDDPEDICQEVFLELHERLSQGLTFAGISVEVWLYQQARELIQRKLEQDWFRRQWTISTSQLDADAYVYTLDQVERQMDGREFIKILKANLSSAELLLLKNAYVDEMTGKQLGALLGISENTLNQRKWRLRKKVERYLKQFNR